MKFKRKRSTRLHPKVTTPLRLADQSLLAVTRLLAETGDQMAKVRNSREKKATRDYLSKNLPVVLHQAILRKAAELFLGAEMIVNLLDLFEPGQDARDRVDLLGPLQFRLGCSRIRPLYWKITTLKRNSLKAPQLEKLFNILIWSDPSQLKELAISVSRNLLKSSPIPNILARGRALTNVTILRGADNHILRILGTSCPRLKYLDVSHSKGVSDQGLLNLLLKRPPHRKEIIWAYANGTYFDIKVPVIEAEDFGDLSLREKNACSETLVSIKLLRTSVGLTGDWYCSDYACQIISNAYMFMDFPFTRVVRVDQPGAIWERGLQFDRGTRRFPPCEGLTDELNVTVSNMTEVILGKAFDLMPPTVMDHLSLPEQGQLQFSRAIVFIREIERTHLRILMKIDSAAITSLVVDFCNTAEDVTLDLIGLTLPHLKYFRGWITGIWNRVDKPFLPKLEVASVWCFNSSTILSMLQHAPAIRLCEFDDSRWDNDVHDPNLHLTDSTLGDCILRNTKLAACLEEIIIRPCMLTSTSLIFLTSHCPNLKMIGDIQSWEISSKQLKIFNEDLDKKGSQCVLSVMNRPPPRIQSFEWI